jgi:hypothetical protein
LGDGTLLETKAGTEVSILLGNGDGAVASLAVADLNSDGFLDLAVWQAGAAAIAPGTVQILFGKGDATFQAGASYPAGSAPIYVVGLAAGDFKR